MKVDRLVVATKNLDKLDEVEAVLGATAPHVRVMTGLDWPDVAETADTLVGNARLKAGAVAAATGFPALADDTGLEVDALQGAPGVHTARYAGPQATYEDNVAALLRALEGRRDRAARFRTVVVLRRPDGGELVADGVLEGRITEAPRGDGGFGYDPVFEIDGRTLAELPAAEKNEISHRAIAVRRLAARLTP